MLLADRWIVSSEMTAFLGHETHRNSPGFGVWGWKQRHRLKAFVSCTEDERDSGSESRMTNRGSKACTEDGQESGEDGCTEDGTGGCGDESKKTDGGWW